MRIKVIGQLDGLVLPRWREGENGRDECEWQF